MSNQQTSRIVIAGMTGGGKSYLARQIIAQMEGRYRQLVIVNRKRELAELTDAAYIVDETGDPAKSLRRHRRVFYQVDGYDPRPFLDNLGMEIMQRRDVLVVIDEAWEFFGRGRVPRGLFRVLTGGRERGHTTIMVTQMLKSASGGIDLAVFQQATHVVLFRLQGNNDLERVMEYFPELGDRVTQLQRPEGGLPPEYAVRNMLTGAAGLVLRDDSNPRRRVWLPLSEAAPAPDWLGAGDGASPL